MLLSDDEMQALVISFLKTRYPKSVDEDEIVGMLYWFQDARLQGILLDIALSGDCELDWNGKEPIFKLSERGRKRVQKMKERCNPDPENGKGNAGNN
jgi:hypothetical protein